MKRLVKKLLYVLALPVVLSACKAPVAQQSGREDMAYLLFVSPDRLAGEDVMVTLDNQEPFAAKVVREKKSKRKGTQYGIKTGPRSIKVTYRGKVLYQKKIFVSSQEVKQIILP